MIINKTGKTIYTCLSILSNTVVEISSFITFKVQIDPYPETEHVYPGIIKQFTHPVWFPLSHYSPVCLMLFPQTSGGIAQDELKSGFVVQI